VRDKRYHSTVVAAPCITNFRTSEDDVEALIGIVQRTGSLIDAGMER
jgi:hypothetical protein